MPDRFRRLMGRVALLFGLGRQTADSDVSTSTQRIQLYSSAQELRSDVPLIQQYGFASRPRPGSDVLFAFLGGDASRPIAFSTQDQRRWPADLKPGEVTLYHPPTGSRVQMKADGSIALLPANGIVTLEGSLNVTRDITATGIVTGQTDVRAADISGKLHTHNHVQAGMAHSGQPDPSFSSKATYV